MYWTNHKPKSKRLVSLISCNLLKVCADMRELEIIICECQLFANNKYRLHKLNQYSGDSKGFFIDYFS